MSDDVKGVITWLYYRDLPAAMEFYENVMGFEMVVDQGWSKILKIRDGAYVGLVDRGARLPSGQRREAGDPLHQCT